MALTLPIWVTPLLFALFLLVAIILFSWRPVRRGERGDIKEINPVPSHAGLIIFLSLFHSPGDQQRRGVILPTWRQEELEAALSAPVIDWPTVLDRVTHSNMQPALAAIQHHIADGTLKHIWFITTADIVRDGKIVQAGSRHLAPLFARVLREGCGWHAAFHYEEPDLLVEPNDPTSAYQAVEYVFEQASLQVGLGPSEVIADFTGGRAPMTAGMVLACAPRNWTMQYTTTERDPVLRDASDYPVPTGIEIKAEDLLLCALDAVRRRVETAKPQT